MDDRLAVLYADGGSRGNPGPSGAGAYISVDGKSVAELAKFLGRATNNVAEYTGLIIGLEKIIELGFKRVEVRMDSLLVVNQMLGLWKVRDEKLKPLFRQAKGLASKIHNFKIMHVRREYNKDADRLANVAMDEALDITGFSHS